MARADDGKLAERDLLLFRDGTLMIVESKAQSFRPIFQHPGDLNRDSQVFLRSSIQKGYDQARSVYRAILRSTGDLAFYDSDKATRTEIARLSQTCVREVFTIVCLDDWYGLIASDLKPWIEVDTSSGLSSGRGPQYSGSDSLEDRHARQTGRVLKVASERTRDRSECG